MNLTGQYDVIAEFSVVAVNRIVAALHANQDPRYPVMPHSMRLAIDDTPRGSGDPVPEAERTGVRAVVEIQVSTPTLSLPHGGPVLGGIAWASPMVSRRGRWDPWEASDVSIRANIRAWVLGSPEPSLPEFVHGDLTIAADVVRTSFDFPTAEIEPVAFRLGPGLLGETFVGLDRSSMSVGFQPAAGTTVSSEERSRIEQLVRNALRSDLEPVTFKVSVPADVHAWDYRLYPGSGSAAIMLVLTDRTPGPTAAQEIAGGLVPPGRDFAVGIGRDFLLPMLRSQVIRDDLPESFSEGSYGVSATIRPDWDGATFDLEPGRIVLAIQGSGHISWWGIDDDFTFDVRVSFGLQVVGGSLEPVAVGDPEVDFHDIAVGEGYAEGKARDRIRVERDNALAAARDTIRQALDLRSRLEEILAGFHPGPAGVTLTGVEIRPEGVVVPGTIALAPTQPVVVRQVERQGMIDALDSWVPGGTIDRFVWTRGELVVSAFMARGGMAHLGSRVEEHRFVTEEMDLGLHDIAGPTLCLEVQGTRVTAGGGMAPVKGHTCGFYVPIPVWPVVDWPLRGGRRAPVLPIQGFRPDGTPGIVGHYNPWGSGRAPDRGAAVLVVHLATGGWDGTAEVLKKGIEGMRKDAPVVAVVLLPPGGLADAGAKLETNAAVVLGEDMDGQWAEAFGVSPPATVVVDPKGRVAWKEEGPLSATKLARALDRHAEPGGRVSLQPVRTGVAPGDTPPEFPFVVGGGAEVSLRRLRGRRAVVLFCASWSEPSMEQLRELRRAHEATAGRGPVVVAVADGETAAAAAEMAKAEGLPFPVIPDPERSISRRFLVGTWPTMLWIGPTMTVEAVDLGLTAVGGGRPTGHRPPAGK